MDRALGERPSRCYVVRKMPGARGVRLAEGAMKDVSQRRMKE